MINNQTNNVMNDKIDIIIPYVNCQDNNWQIEYKKYFNDFNPARFRTNDLFKYVFRGIAENCKWINKIFLIVSQESQIPTWINKKEVNIILHKDYIPKDFLPTFNSNVIELFYHLIPGLSENFILFNDDTFVIKPLDENYFFENNKPIMQTKINGYNYWKCPPDGDKLFVNTINNNIKLIEQLIGKKIFYHHFHMPVAYKKTLFMFVWEKFKTELYNSLICSKIRHEKNYTHWLIEDLQKTFNIALNKPIYEKSKVYTTNDLNFNGINNYNLICYNDENSKNYEKSINTISKILYDIFPKKCKYEL